MHFQFKSPRRMKKSYYRDETPWNKMYCQWIIQIALPKLKSQLQLICRRSKGGQNKRWKNIETLSKPNILLHLNNKSPTHYTTHHPQIKDTYVLFSFASKKKFIEVDKKILWIVLLHVGFPCTLLVWTYVLIFVP